jgi:hypothetical protein
LYALSIEFQIIRWSGPHKKTRRRTRAVRVEVLESTGIDVETIGYGHLGAFSI